MKTFLIWIIIFNCNVFLFPNDYKLTSMSQNFVKGEIIIKPANLKTLGIDGKKAAVVTRSFIKKHSNKIESISQYKNSGIFIVKIKNVRVFRFSIIP